MSSSLVRVWKRPQGFATLTRLLAAIAGYLLLVLQGSSAVVEITEQRVAAEGSSILMHAPEPENISFIEWEYIRNATPEFILQYYAAYGSPTIYTAYRDRVLFYPENGSVLLQRLRETDSGIYRATVNLMQHEARTTLLEVIKPVPQPELQSRSNLAGSPIELVCVVPEGTVASISWKKEGRPLPPEKCYVLPGDTTVLQIRDGEKSDCGSYSCNVSNVISWKEAALNLTVTGLTPPLRHVQRLAVIVLIFFTGSAISFVVLLHQMRKQGFAEEAMKAATVLTHGLLCISSLLLFVISIIWMQEKGISAAFILLGLFVLAAVVATGWVAAVVAWKPAGLSSFRMKSWHQVIQSSIASATLIINLSVTTFLLYNIQQLHERGCSEAVDLQTSCVPAAVVVLLLLLLPFLWYYRKKQKRKKKMKIRHISCTTEATVTLVVQGSQGPGQERE